MNEKFEENVFVVVYGYREERIDLISKITPKGTIVLKRTGDRFNKFGKRNIDNWHYERIRKATPEDFERINKEWVVRKYKERIVKALPKFNDYDGIIKIAEIMDVFQLVKPEEE